MDNHQRELQDICNVFTELSGALASPKRDAGVLIPFIKEYKWGIYDFRLIIEFSLKDPSSKEFLNTPGRMNLRSIFGVHRRDMLLDIHADLIRIKEIQKKSEENKTASPDVKINKLRLTDGSIFEAKYIKIPDSSVIPGGFRWKWDNQDS